MLPHPPKSTLFPYTTLFRSCVEAVEDVRVVGVDPRDTAAVRRAVERFDDDVDGAVEPRDRKSTRLNSSHSSISYAVFCLKKKKIDFGHHRDPYTISRQTTTR